MGLPSMSAGIWRAPCRLQGSETLEKDLEQDCEREVWSLLLGWELGQHPWKEHGLQASLSSSQEPLIAWGPIILDCENEIEHLLRDEGLNENWSHRTPEIAQPNNLPVGRQV